MFKLIKWVFKTLLVITGVMSATRCGSGYKEKNGKIYFNGKEITSKSFVVLNDVFAKDSAHAYYKDQSIPGVDLPSFSALDEYYAKDKNHVYYCNEFREGQNYYLTKKKTIDSISGADVSTFVSVGDGYAKDQQQAYFEGTPFKVEDVGSFEGINPYFSKDSKRAYFKLHPIKGSDGKSFELINTNYAWDTNQVYFYGYPGEVKSEIYTLSCDRATFGALDYPYSKDKASVFYEDKKMHGLDAKSFTMRPKRSKTWMPEVSEYLQKTTLLLKIFSMQETINQSSGWTKNYPMQMLNILKYWDKVMATMGKTFITRPLF
jgi:hypothetical protein